MRSLPESEGSSRSRLSSSAQAGALSSATMTRRRLQSDFFNGLLERIMYRDSVAEEVHRFRQKLLKECGDDLDWWVEKGTAHAL